MKTQTLKLNLEDITVQSFVTSVEENSNEILAGMMQATKSPCSALGNCHIGDHPTAFGLC
jgi:hypothetical protein